MNPTPDIPRILLVEDDLRLATLVADYLDSNGLLVHQLHRGDQVLPWLTQHEADLMVLDLMLPGLDGQSVCRRLRPRHALPVLVLTARSDEFDQVLCLELGADDYVVKPVQPRLLLARIRALLRRPQPQTGLVWVQGALRLDRMARQVSLGDDALDLTPSEYALLDLLCRRLGQTLSRDDILLALRGMEFDGVDRSADVLVSRLRRKLKAWGAEHIETVRGRGYRLQGSTA
jgi:DNA-binding response OmpR family regulator